MLLVSTLCSTPPQHLTCCLRCQRPHLSFFARLLLATCYLVLEVAEVLDKYVAQCSHGEVTCKLSPSCCVFGRSHTHLLPDPSSSLLSLLTILATSTDLRVNQHHQQNLTPSLHQPLRRLWTHLPPLPIWSSTPPSPERLPRHRPQEDPRLPPGYQPWGGKFVCIRVGVNIKRL